MIKPKDITGNIRARFSAPKDLMVFEYDRFGLRALVVTNKRGKLSIENMHESNLSDPDKALEAIMRHFQPEKSLPGKAIVVSSEVAPTILELPVNPKSQRAYRQMHELVRWELDPFLAELTASNAVGVILVGKSYITHEQAKELVLAGEEEKSALHQADQPSFRFGELALKKGFITNDQLEECLSIQDRSRSVHDDPVCGWAYQMPSDQIAGDGEKYKWLACGVGRSVRNKWKERLEKFKLGLSGLYPLTTSATACLNGTASSGARCALFEIYPGSVSCTQLVDGSIGSLQVCNIEAEEKPSAESCVNLLGNDDVDQILFAGRGDNIEGLATETEKALDIKSKLFVPDNPENMPAGTKAESLVNTLGAASHAFRLSGARNIAYVRAEEPPPPFKTQPAIWILTAAVIMTVGLGIVEASMQLKMKLLKKESERITLEMDPLKEANKKISEKIALNEKLQKRLAEKKAAIKNGNKRLEALNIFVNERPEFSLYLLKAISAAIPDSVVLDKLTEADASIELTGWTMAEEAAQQFAENLAVAINGKVNDVGDLRIWTDERQSGEPIYSFSLKMK